RAYDVTLGEVAEAVRRANVNVAGGYLDMGVKGPLVSVTGRLETADELKTAVVRADPLRPIRLGDVAEVEFGPGTIRVGDAGINGGPGVIMVIMKQPDVDTVALTERVDAELLELAKE